MGLTIFVREIRHCDHSNKSYFAVLCPVVLFIMQYKVALSFKSEMLECDHSNGSYCAALSYGSSYYAV